MRTIIKHVFGCNSVQAAKCKKHQIIFCSCEAGGLCPECDMEMKSIPAAVHTPLPWKYISEYDEAYIDGPDPSQKGMINFYLSDTLVGHENAKLIVKAVNSFYEFKELLNDWLICYGQSGENTQLIERTQEAIKKSEVA